MPYPRCLGSLPRRPSSSAGSVASAHTPRLIEGITAWGFGSTGSAGGVDLAAGLVAWSVSGIRFIRWGLEVLCPSGASREWGALVPLVARRSEPRRFTSGYRPPPRWGGEGLGGLDRGCGRLRVGWGSAALIPRRDQWHGRAGRGACRLRETGLGQAGHTWEGGQPGTRPVRRGRGWPSRWRCRCRAR